MFASPWADAPCRPQDVGMLTNSCSFLSCQTVHWPHNHYLHISQTLFRRF